LGTEFIAERDLWVYGGLGPLAGPYPRLFSLQGPATIGSIEAPTRVNALTFVEGKCAEDKGGASLPHPNCLSFPGEMVQMAKFLFFYAGQNPNTARCPSSTSKE